MTITTMVVATAMLTMFAELRIKLVSAAMTPYRVRSTALMIELVFGEWNKPVPALCIINMTTIHKTGKSVDRHVANMNAEQVDNPNPAMVNFRHPNLSDRRPLIGPSTTIHKAGGIINNPISLGLQPRIDCK